MKRRKSTAQVKEIPASAMMLLPPRPDACQECAVKHDPALPHNRDSLYYQIRFQMQHGRSPTWDDAMAHCTDEMRTMWKETMAQHLASLEKKEQQS